MIGGHRQLGLPVAGELSASLAEVIAGGQPVVLTLDGRPAGVLVDLDSWAEIEEVVGESE